jgi:hypothetical protein
MGIPTPLVPLASRMPPGAIRHISKVCAVTLSLQ